MRKIKLYISAGLNMFYTCFYDSNFFFSVFHRDTNITMKLLTLCALLCAMMAVTTAGGEYGSIISIIYIYIYECN